MEFNNYVKAFSCAIKTRVLEFEQTTFQPVRSRLLQTANAQFAADGTIYIDTLPTKIESLKVVLDQSPLDSLESLGATIGAVLSPINIILKLAFGALCFLTFQHGQMMSVFGLKKSCPCDQLIKPSEENLQPTPPQDSEEKVETPPADDAGADGPLPPHVNGEGDADRVPESSNGQMNDGAHPPHDNGEEEVAGIPDSSNGEENGGIVPPPIEYPPNQQEDNEQKVD